MKDPFIYLGTNWKAGLKIFVIAIVLFFILSIGFKSISRSFTFFVDQGRNMVTSNSGFDRLEMMDEDVAMEGAYSQKMVAGMPSLVPPRDGGYTQGDDAEDYEVTQYNANIRTKTIEETCGKIFLLKSRQDVIFENAYEYDKGCNYSFKVKLEKAEEILAIIKALNPYDLSENTYTIQKMVNSITSETEILSEKLNSINDTLDTALSAYDEITDLATKNRDAESLATVIDSKVRLIERLTQERINISAQLDRLQRSKEEQLDRLGYTVFSVSVTEDKYIDGKQIKESWKSAVQQFIRDANKTLQEMSVGLIVFVLTSLQFVLSFLVVVFIAKFAWIITKRIWKRR